MNTFLIHMATNLKELRELMNWKQEELAEAIEISRPSLIALERDPSRLNKTTALAIFNEVDAALADRRNKLKSVKFKLWGQSPKQQAAILSALAAIGLTGRFLGTADGIFSTGAVLSGVGAFAAGFLGMKGILKLVSHLTTPKSKQGVPEEGIPNDVSPEELQEFSEKAFTLLETKVLACLGLEKMDLTEFRRKIKESEVS